MLFFHLCKVMTADVLLNRIHQCSETSKASIADFYSVLLGNPRVADNGELRLIKARRALAEPWRFMNESVPLAVHWQGQTFIKMERSWVGDKMQVEKHLLTQSRWIDRSSGKLLAAPGDFHLHNREWEFQRLLVLIRKVACTCKHRQKLQNVRSCLMNEREFARAKAVFYSHGSSSKNISANSRDSREIRRKLLALRGDFWVQLCFCFVGKLCAADLLTVIPT